MSKNAVSRQGFDPLKLRRKMALAFVSYSSAVILTLLTMSLFATLTGALSQATLNAVFQTYAQPLLMEWLGLGRGSEVVQWLTTLLRFSPVIITVLSIWLSCVVGLIASMPHLLTAYALHKGKNWLPIVATISILMALPVFPFGTALALYAIYGFYTLNQATEARVYGS